MKEIKLSGTWCCGNCKMFEGKYLGRNGLVAGKCKRYDLVTWSNERPAVCLDDGSLWTYKYHET